MFRRPAPPPVWTSKEDAECCRALSLPDGRPVIGWCSDGCERRLEHLRRLAEAR